MAERYRPGLLATDLGLDGGPILDVTPRGIAVVVDGRLLGYTSADELRAIVKSADEQCPTCGQPKDWRPELAAQIRRLT
jgi:hypothetical protein